jgi:hypothetical protein
MEKYGRYRQATGDDVIRRTHIARWIHKATGTHSDYVILVVFTRQKGLQESAYVLRLYIFFLLLKRGFVVTLEL